jgi:AraC-like DNA-binding protein
VRYREIPPAPPLSPFIEAFWTLDSDDSSDGPPQRVVPDGHAELILNLSTPFEYCDDAGHWHRQPRLFFAGQIRGPLLLRAAGPARIIGVRFTPHGAAAMLRAPMHELAGRFTPIDNFFPALHRALKQALDSRDPIRAVEGTLLRIAHHADPAVAAAVECITASRGTISLNSLANDLNLSSRQFERRFHTAVGLAPKTFCSLKRFVEVFRVIGDGDPRWVDTALACGYYDQAHLIRDFKRFSGETPAALLAPDADLARHFLLRFGVSHSYNTGRVAAL